jgi:hypothetical protein
MSVYDSNLIIKTEDEWLVDTLMVCIYEVRKCYRLHAFRQIHSIYGKRGPIQIWY